MEIATIDPMSWVKSCPRHFFRNDEPDTMVILAYIMTDILEVGHGECIIRHVDEWYAIGSDLSWLEHEEYQLLDMFNHVIPAPAHGEHSMRGEILVNAFARDVAVVGASGSLQIKGNPPPLEVLKKTEDMEQAIVFRL